MAPELPLFFRLGQPILDPAQLSAIRVHQLQSTFLQRLREAAEKDVYWQGIRDALEEKKTGLDPALSFKEELVFYKNCWYVPEGRDLHQEIFLEHHDSRIAGCFGQFKTGEKIKANFYWPNMDRDIEEYVRSCDSCQRNKTTRHKKYGMLQLLEVPYRP